MSAAMEQHATWLAARARLEAGNNKVRTEKVVTLKTVVRGKTAQVVRISPDVPLPDKAKAPVRPTAGRGRKRLELTDTNRILSILRYVSTKHGVSINALRGRQRFVHVMVARQEAYYLLLTEGALSSPEAGRQLGGKHHTTVLYGARMHAIREGRATP